MPYFYVAASIFLTVYCQLVLKWRISGQESLPDALAEKILAMAGLIFQDLWVMSGFAATFLGAIFWMMAMSKLSISIAYPFMSLAFVFVMLGAAMFLGEPLSAQKLVGTLLIVAGLIVVAQ